MKQSMRPKLVILSTSLLTDRILLHSSFPEALLQFADAEVWVSSYPSHKELWRKKNFDVRPFPKINRLRFKMYWWIRVNNQAWAVALKAVSILSLQRFDYKRAKERGLSFSEILTYTGRSIGSILGRLGLHKKLERWLMSRLQKHSHSPEAFNKLKKSAPDLLMVTNPMWALESTVALEARKLNIPIFSLVPSWDNITTKSRFPYYSNAYAVWSEIRRQELLRYYPYTQSVPIHVVGAPQYDVFYEIERRQSRKMFCERNGLNCQLPIVLYALGSPLFIKSEFTTIVDVLKKMKQDGALQTFQVLIRPHPHKQNRELIEELSDFHPHVKIQEVGQAGLPTEKRSQSEVQINDWINTIFHCNVIINLSSTILLDGAMFHKPVININFDHSIDKAYHSFIKEIHSTWVHIRDVVASGANVYVNSAAELITAVERALENPGVRRENMIELRKMIVNNEDGKSGQRLALSVLSTLSGVCHGFKIERKESGEIVLNEPAC